MHSSSSMFSVRRCSSAESAQNRNAGKDAIALTSVETLISLQRSGSRSGGSLFARAPQFVGIPPDSSAQTLTPKGKRFLGERLGESPDRPLGRMI
jgi:hypothetical protein